jgi:putative NADPH-quinone reductase
MRILVVFAHPTRESFSGALLAVVLEELAAQGHELDLLDLYAERFDPVLSEREWRCYEKKVDPEIQRYAEQIHLADGLIWVFPTWNNGLPAILKGYVDRVWKPNVAFRIDQSHKVRFDSLDNLNFFVAITTYGASWMASTLVGNPCKRFLVKGLRRHLPLRCGFVWHAIYGMDKPSPRHLSLFLENIRQTLKDYPARFASSGSAETTARIGGRLSGSMWEWLYRFLPG